MTTHATLSPSARHRWSLCPASVRESLKYPERKSSPFAIDGTHTHTLLELCLKTKCRPVVGAILADDDGTFTVDDDRAERVNFALDYIYLKGGIVQSEVRVYPKIGRDDVSGTVDVLIINPNVVEIIDYKDGVGEVEVENNPQLSQYALGVLAEQTGVETVIMTIIQPKLNTFGKSAVKSVTLNADKFYNTELDKLKAEALATDDPNAPHVAGEVQCGWCPHAGNCGELATQTLAKSNITFGSVTPVLVQAMELNTIDLTPEKIRDIIEATPMIKQFLESVEEQALASLQEGKTIDGLKVVRGRGTRSWNSGDAEIAEKLNKMKVPLKELWVEKLISPAQLEKLKWVNKLGAQKTLSPKQLQVVKSDLISTSEGRLTVVSAADERQAVEFKPVEDMFVPDWMF